MVVQHNMQAANANRMLGITTGAQAKSTEKLSSGYRINRAADDAAGLTISEKMRKQIKGLDQASTNAQDGVSAVQTAEGAMTEVHSMLQRMNELATQASNGTNSQSDRDAIQAEISQLTTEIDRVAETTKFNETYLLQGNGTSGTQTVNAHDAGLTGTLADNGDGTSTFTADALSTGSKVTIAGTEYSIVDSAKATDYTNINGYTAAAGDILVKDGTKYTYVANGATTPGGQTAGGAGWFKEDNATTSADTVTLASGDKLTKNGGTETTLVGATGNAYTISTMDATKTAIAALAKGDSVAVTDSAGTTTNYTLALATTSATSVTVDDLMNKISGGMSIVSGSTRIYVLPADSGKDTDVTAKEAYDLMAKELETASSIGTDTAATVTSKGDGTFTITQGTVAVDNALSFNLQVGADADMTNKINVSIDTMSAAGLGIKGINVSDTSGAKATYAIDAIADAISKVSSQRSALGAVQNRLEHTIANLDNVVENTSSAESRIRDTDMAEEMVNYSKNNILSQAGQSMLAQANQSTQGVLSLLQ